MSTDALIHREQFPPPHDGQPAPTCVTCQQGKKHTAKRCRICRLVAHHVEGYTPSALGHMGACWTCLLRGESAYFKQWGFAGVGYRS